MFLHTEELYTVQFRVKLGPRSVITPLHSSSVGPWCLLLVWPLFSSHFLIFGIHPGPLDHPSCPISETLPSLRRTQTFPLPYLALVAAITSKRGAYREADLGRLS